MSDKGFFANAAAADLPPDDAQRQPLLNVGEPPEGGDAAAKAKEAEAASKTAEAEKAAGKEKEAAAAAEAEKAKAEADKSKGDLTNPNLTGEAGAKEEGAEEEKKPVGMTDKAFVAWKAIRASEKVAIKERDDVKAELATLKTELEAAKKSAPEAEAIKKELAETKQRLADYEGEISVTRVEATKKFKETITAPLAGIESDIAELAKRYEIEPEDLMPAIREPDAAKRAKALEEATSDFKSVDKLEVVQAARDYQRLQKAAAAMRQDAGKQLEEITRETNAENEKRTAMTTQDYRAAVNTVWEQAQQANPDVRRVDGHEKWNAHLDGIRRSVEAVNVNELPVEEVAKMNVSHHLLPEIRAVASHFKTAYTKEKERADAAEKKLADYLKTAPGAGGGQRTEDRKGEKGGGLFADAVLAEAT